MTAQTERGDRETRGGGGGNVAFESRSVQSKAKVLGQMFLRVFSVSHKGKTLVVSVLVLLTAEGRVLAS